jgi:hypothetical protein
VSASERMGEWKVLPHGELERLSENVFRVEAPLVKGPPIVRVMTVARLRSGQLVIHSAIALEESAMQELEALGKVAYLIVPNHWHRLDAARYARRYADAKVLCPPGSRQKVEQVVRVDGTYADFPGGERVRFEVLEGVGEAEGVMIVEDDEGATLVLSDVLFNMPHRRGVSGFVLRYLTHSSGGPRISRLLRLALIKDRRALRRHLERLADLPRLQRIVVAHHEVIDRQPAQVLRDVAATL